MYIKKLKCWCLAIFAAMLFFAVSTVQVQAGSSNPSDTDDPSGPNVTTPVFVPISRITLEAQAAQTGRAFSLTPVVYPENSTVRTVEWSFPHGHPEWITLSGNTITSRHEGSITVMATAEDGGHNNNNFTQIFTIHFSDSVITATLRGIRDLHVGVSVNAYVLFELEGSTFMNEIFPADFFVTGLPAGLRFEEAVRVNNTQVRLPITGTPSVAMNHGGGWGRITPPTTIPARNIARASFPVGVNNRGMDSNVTVGASAVVVPGSITFDRYPDSGDHRDVFVSLHRRDHDFVRIAYGRVQLEAYEDFFHHHDGAFTIYASFLRRMAVGTWDLEFVMRTGDNPVLRVTIVDSTPPPPIIPGQPVRPGFPLPELPRVAVGPAPIAPMVQPHPDESFLFLSGGQAVNSANLNFGTTFARVMPTVQNGTASMTARANLFEYLAWQAPHSGFEMRTPLARVFVPLDMYDLMVGARQAVANRGLSSDAVDIRVSVIDRSGGAHVDALNATFPYGQAMSNLVEIRAEILEANANAETVIFTASEFYRPIDSVHTIMPMGGHLRPTAVYFNPTTGWPEFAPNVNLNQNEVRIRSRFTGVHGVVNNGMIFDDIPHGHWAFEQAYTAAYSGLVVAAGELNPSVTISRGEFVQLLAFAMQLPRSDMSAGYSDVAFDSPFYDGISRARAIGILGFWGGNYFEPYAPITRQEMLTMVGIAAWMHNPGHDILAVPLQGRFTDSLDVDMRYFQSVQAALNFGLFGGNPGGEFRPNDSATRIEALAVVINLARVLGLMG